MEQQILSAYKNANMFFDPNDSRFVAWENSLMQSERWEALYKIGNLSHSSVLDIGCGVGDIIPHLKDNFSDVDYFGIDINPQIIAAAKSKYPKEHFLQRNFFDNDWPLSPTQNRWDWIVASGAFSIKLSEDDHHIVLAMNKMVTLCNKGAAFNFLSTKTKHKDKMLHYYDEEKVFSYAKRKWPNCRLVSNYLSEDPESDQTLYIYMTTGL
jgi:ubiquinone/menaquinone biosynthesis C-methylase UbiE